MSDALATALIGGLIAVMIAIIGPIGNWLTNRAQTKAQALVSDASAAEHLSAAYTALLKEKDEQVAERDMLLNELRHRIAALETNQLDNMRRITQLENERVGWSLERRALVEEMRDLKSGVDKLVTQIEALGQEPAYRRKKTAPFQESA